MGGGVPPNMVVCIARRLRARAASLRATSSMAPSNQTVRPPPLPAPPLPPTLQVSYRAPTSCARGFPGGGEFEGEDSATLNPTSELLGCLGSGPSRKRARVQAAGAACCSYRASTLACKAVCKRRPVARQRCADMRRTPGCLLGAAIPGAGAGCKVNLGRGLFPHKFRWASG